MRKKDVLALPRSIPKAFYPLTEMRLKCESSGSRTLTLIGDRDRVQASGLVLIQG